MVLEKATVVQLGKRRSSKSGTLFMNMCMPHRRSSDQQPHTDLPEMNAMLQEQQRVLKKVRNTQQAMQSKQKDFDLKSRGLRVLEVN